MLAVWIIFFAVEDSFAEGDPVEVMLSKAVKENDLATVKRLIDNGADPEVGQFGFPLLSAASLQGNAEIVSYLISKGADPMKFTGDFAAIHLAVSGHNTDVVQVLLEAGVPIDLPTKESWHPPLLMHAARNNAIEMMSFLLSKGADINVRDKCNDPAVAASAYYGHVEATEFLIENGADLTTKSTSGGPCVAGSTAVSYATKRGHDNIAEMLLKAGAVE